MSVVFLIGLVAGFAVAQSRKSVQLRGNLTVGQGPSTWNTSNAMTYMSGTEGLQQSRPTTGYTGSLGSNIYQPQSMSRTIRSVAPVPGTHTTMGASPAATHRRLYTPTAAKLPTVARMRAPSAPAGSARPSYVSSFTGGAAQKRASDETMQREMKARREELLKTPDKPVTTLVPEAKGRYRDFMKSGEWAFKSGRYDEALQSFQQARLLTPSVPGAMIGCMMANFARPKANYKEAGESLARAIQVFPELPMVNLPPKQYFGSPEEYDKAMARLEAHVRQTPKDANAQFLLAYLLWRVGKFAPAEAAMTSSLENSGSPDLTQAMETFVRGVAKTSRQYKGKLESLDAPKVYPQVGVELALPKGFVQRRADQAFEVLVATQGGSAEMPEEFIGLYAHAVNGDTTPGLFLASALDRLRSNPDFANLKEVERGTGLVADTVMDARILQYQFRGRSSHAAVACFVRSVTLPGQPQGAAPIRIAYLLVGEVAETKKDELLPNIVAVARSVKFTELKRPLDLPIEAGTDVVDEAVGIVMAPPASWSAAATPEGILMGQMDYVLGGVTSPLAQASKIELAQPLPNEQAVKKIVASEKEKGYVVKLLSQGPAKLGQYDGYQLVMQKQVQAQGVSDKEMKKFRAAEPMTKPGPPFIEVVRFTTQQRNDGKTVAYFIGMSCYDTGQDQAGVVMDTLAKTFRRLPAKASPTTKTTTAPK